MSEPFSSRVTSCSNREKRGCSKAKISRTQSVLLQDSADSVLGLTPLSPAIRCTQSWDFF